MATNIVIKKLENKVFDDHIEAEKRLAELGAYNDTTSETYKDLADQVRSICPCNCHFSTRKRYMVEITYSYSIRSTESNNYDDKGYEVSTDYQAICTGDGFGYIEKGNTSTNNLQVHSKFSKYGTYFAASDYYDYTACDTGIDSTINFSIRLSDDCKHWIFSYSPILRGTAKFTYPGATSDECMEMELRPTSESNKELTIENYPEVTTAYPSGTMTLKYEYHKTDEFQSGASIWTKDVIDEVTIIEATVTPLDDNVNTLNTINSLYSDLSENLK